MSAAEQSPTDLDALARAMMGTEDGGMLDGNEEIPIGECYRLAAEWFTDGQYKSPSEVEQLLRQARAEAWDEAVTALDATCGGSHAGMIANPYGRTKNTEAD